MARCQNCPQNLFHVPFSMDRADDRFRRCERCVDLRARGNGAVGFRRMIEQFFRKLHRPGNVGRAPVKFAVDEIGAAPEEQPERRSHAKVVGEIGPGKFVPTRVIKREEQEADHPAVAGHSAFPHAQNRQWLAQHFRFVEKNVTEPATDDHAEERATRDEIAHS